MTAFVAIAERPPTFIDDQAAQAVETVNPLPTFNVTPPGARSG